MTPRSDSSNDEEEVAPDSVTTVGDNITIISNTMTPPPGGWAFKEFPSPNPWHFVDIETDPEAPPGSADTDTGSAIKISVEDVPETAGTWPLKGEGNLLPAGGGGGEPPTWHWSAKAYKIFPILYKDNTTWTEEARLTSDPVHLFTMDVIAGVEILSAPGKTVKAKMWTGDDTENKVTITLTETGAGTGVYRNTGTGTWPHFYRIYDAANKRLKVVDEDKKWYVVPIVDDKEYPGLEVSEKVDSAEVAALDATMTEDAEKFYDEMGKTAAGEPAWVEKEHFYYHVEEERPNVTDDKCYLIGRDNDFIYIAGHGLMTRAAIAGDQDGHPLGDYHDEPEDPEFPNQFAAWDIAGDWDGECEWVTFAACSQVLIPDPEDPESGDNAVWWIVEMPKVHGLLGYKASAPGSGTDVNIADRFVDYMHGLGGKAKKTIVNAWMQANEDYLAWNATALIQKECVADKCKTLDAFPTPETGETKYIYYRFEDEAVETYEITLP